MRSTSLRSIPKSASGARNAKPPAMARYFSTISLSVIVLYSNLHVLYPNVRAGISVRRVDVKKIRFSHLSEGLAQFRSSVLCAEERAGRTRNSLRLIEVGHF